MKQIIVVGVDGTGTASKAARTARELAVAMGATLHVVAAYEDDRTGTVSRESDKWMVSDAGRAAAVARKTAEEIITDNLQIESFAVNGAPAEALIKHAEGSSAAIIVVGNKRMRGLQRVLGSVANKVAHNAPCDVHIVKTD